jgi:titin
VLINLPQNTTSFVDSGLAPNTLVSYQVAAGNIKGQTAFTNIASTTTYSAPTIGSLTGVSTSPTSVDLTWTLTPLTIAGVPTPAPTQGVSSYVVTRTGGLLGQATFNVTGTDTPTRCTQ